MVKNQQYVDLRKVLTMKQKRTTETKSYIKQALTRLINIKNFEEISVTMICREAGINRGTFYLHYIDKYDMIEKMKEETFADIYSIIGEDTSVLSKEVILGALLYINKDFEFISALSTSTYVDLPRSIRQFITTVLDKIPNFDQSVEERYHIPTRYARTSYIASIESIISRWIADGGQESPEEMADIVYKIAC